MYIETFAQRIKKAREMAGLTQKQVEEITGIDQPKLSRIESGKIEPNIETLCTLIDLYDADSKFVLGTNN